MMKPLNIYGSKPFSKSDFAGCLLFAAFFAWVITSNLHIESLITYLIILLFITLVSVILLFYCKGRKIFLFYNSYMLYRENMGIIDIIKLMLIKNRSDLIDDFFDKRNYININCLKIYIKNIDAILTEEKGAEAEFQLIFNDQKCFNFRPEDTKEAYQKFLTPFLNYNVYIDDPYDLVDGIYQPLRLTEYLKNTQ